MNIPQEWTDILLAVRTKFPTAIIAGGCLRDLDNEKPVKDVDIFVEYAGDTTQAQLEEAIGGAVFPLVTEAATEYLDMAFDNVVAIYDLPPLEDKAETDDWLAHLSAPVIPIQVIAQKKLVIPFDAVDRFDLGICRISYDGTEVFRTSAYITDKATNSMTVVRCEGTPQMERTKRRFDRLSEKYPNHVFKVQRDFEKFLPQPAVPSPFSFDVI